MQHANVPTRPHRREDGIWILSRHADVVALLGRSDCTVHPRESEEGSPSVGWLRARVARFCNGVDHERRRMLVENDIRHMSSRSLRLQAHDRTVEFCQQRGGQTFDVMSTAARLVPSAVLASSLGVGPAEIDSVAGAVRDIAPMYLSPSTTPEADAAVRRLVELLGPESPEVVANRIGLLVQGCEAMAGLIGSAIVAILGPTRSPAWPVEGVIRELLRHDPPVRIMRRQAAADIAIGGIDIPAGATIQLDLVAANRDPDEFPAPDRFDPHRETHRHLTFGAGVRPCPGSEQAVALSVGVTAAVVERCRLVETAVTYVGLPALHIPERLLVATESE